MYFAGKLVYLIVRASNKLAVSRLTNQIYMFYWIFISLWKLYIFLISSLY